MLNLDFSNFNCFKQLMLEKTLGFLSSKISMTSSCEQLGKQPLSRKPLGKQFDQNHQNKLSHTSFGTYPLKPLSDSPSTMHK
jgi:hypothetical protein